MKAVLHFQKINNFSGLSALDSHNLRLKNVANADPYGLAKNLKGENILSDVRTRIDGLPQRKNSVLAVTTILSASPEYFRPDDPSKAGYYEKKRLDSWMGSTLNWLSKEYGENFVNATLHLDEATPHIHAIITPVIEGRLSAKKMFNPTSLRIYQTTYAKSLRHLGIKRGQTNSQAKHVDVKEYYEKVNSELPKIRNEISEKQVQSNKLDSEIKTKNELNKKYNEDIHLKKNVIKNLANDVRGIDLEYLASNLGYKQDRHDKHKWCLSGNSLSINEHKFYSHTVNGFKGGGAIDFMIKHQQCDFNTAVSYLSDMNIDSFSIKKDVAICAVKATAESLKTIENSEKYIEIPQRDDTKLNPVKEYLSEIRKIPKKIIDYCINSLKNIYADTFGNAIFVHNTPDGEITGAEKRGINNSCYKGLSKGTKISHSGGAFILPGNDDVVVTESAIDALSYKAITNTDNTIISVAGARNKAKIIDKYIKNNQKIKIAYDDDSAGKNAYLDLKELYPNLSREKSIKAKDWNESLINSLTNNKDEVIKEKPQRSLKNYINKAPKHKTGLKEKLQQIRNAQSKQHKHSI
jgi:hypothetical protein